MREKDIQTKVKNYIDKNPQLIPSGAFELKFTKTDYLQFSRIEDHQLNNLLRVKSKGMYYKIPDVGFSQKPFDFFFLKETGAYLAICYWVPRKQTNVYFIDIQNFMLFKADPYRKKRIYEFEADNLCEFKVSL